MDAARRGRELFRGSTKPSVKSAYSLAAVLEGGSGLGMARLLL